MAQQSARRGWDNQGFPLCFEHATGDLDPVRELRVGAALSHIGGNSQHRMAVTLKLSGAGFENYLARRSCSLWASPGPPNGR